MCGLCNHCLDCIVDVSGVKRLCNRCLNNALSEDEACPSWISPDGNTLWIDCELPRYHSGRHSHTWSDERDVQVTWTDEVNK